MSSFKRKIKIARGTAFLLISVMLVSILTACSGPIIKDPTRTTGDSFFALAGNSEASTESALDSARSEFVYAQLGADGQPQNIYVVNRVPAGSQGVLDQGDYAGVKMLSMTGELLQTAAGYEASASDSEPFFYQGNLKTTTLPWSVSIGYKLNNVVVTAPALSGAAGELEIALSVKPQKSAWADNLMLQISVTLPGSSVSGLSAEGGTLAMAGSDQLITYVMLPGSEASAWTIKAAVKNFYMPSVQIAAVPMSFNLADFTLPEIELPAEFAELTDLQDGTKKLAAGARELADGLGQVDAGSPDLRNGFAQLQNAARELDEAAATITKGIDAYLGGVDQLGAGGTELSAGFAAVPGSAEQIVTGLNGLADGFEKYGSGVSQYVDGINPVLGGIQSTAQGADQLQSGAQEMSSAFTGLQSGGTQLTAASRQIYEGLAAMEAQLQALGSNADIQALKQLLAQQDLAAAGQQLSAGSTTIRNTLDQLSGGLTQLKAAATGLYQGLGQLITSLEQAGNLSREEILQAVGIDPATVVPVLPPGGGEPVPANEDRLIAFYQAQQTGLLNGLRALYNQEQAGQPAPAKILNDTLPQLADGLAALASQYAAFDAEIQAMATMLQQFASLGNLLENLPALSGSAAAYLDFDQGLNSFVAGVSQLADGFNGTEQSAGLSAGIAGLANGLSQLAGGVAPLQTAGTELKTGAVALSVGGRELADGLQLLTDGLHAFRTGLDEYTGGVSMLTSSNKALSSGLHQFSGGLTEFTDGMFAYRDGLSSYTGGISSIASGANKLADGTKELHEGTLDIDAQIEKMTAEMAAKVRQDMEEKMQYETELPSFAAAKNGNVSQIQFVLMTAAIPEKAASEPAEPEKPAAGSVWSRFLDLFR